ncbi:MAG: AAA family ATPase [Rickettsiales bacterium]|jgi:general secretion pathway protein A|nr:AAA family ATPase [Rickettsiales bacterium]
MYNDFFGFKKKPFTIAPDPRFLYMSERHRDALAHLLYGISSGGGFVMLTGEVGTGKTTVCRCLLEQLSSNVRLAYILNPKLDAIELMATMCDELGIEYEPGEKSLKAFTDLLRDRLLENHEQGLNTVLMIDEAQNLSVEVMEQIRLLTNLETNERKLLQIILIGQPELQELLAKKELRQLAQRITARYHLKPLSLKETASYIEHRLRVAGIQRPLIKSNSIKQIYQASGGVPRLINIITDRSLLGAFVERRNTINEAVVKKAVNEVLGKYEEKRQPRAGQSRWWFVAASVVFVILLSYIIIKQFLKPTDLSEKQQLVENSQSETLSSNKSNAASHSGTLLAGTMTNDEVATQFWQEQSWDRTGAVSARNLFALWGVNYYPYQSGDPCEYALNYNLNCDSGRADWAYIKQLNRPVNLKFSTETSGQFWGTLKEIDGEYLVLQFADNEVRVLPRRLNPLWQGEYHLFWKAPDGFSEHAKKGDSGAAVRWLTDAIYSIDQVNISPADYFSQKVEDWLILFQMENGLVSDGILGKHSVIMINNHVVANIPKLINELSTSQRGAQ